MQELVPTNRIKWVVELSITTFMGRQLRQIYDHYNWLRMYAVIKLARGEFQQRLDKYIKGISGTLTNITYRQAEVENAHILYPIQFHWNPRRGHGMPVQQQLVFEYLEKDAINVSVELGNLMSYTLCRSVAKNTEKSN